MISKSVKREVKIFIRGFNFADKLSYDKVYNLILAKDIQQMVFTSRFVTKLVGSEIENRIADLEVSSKEFLKYDENQKELVVEKIRIEEVSEGKIYISDVIDESDSMIFAVPINNKDFEPIGVLWGHYRVARIAENIELNNNSHRYFQIVDDSGRYISDSNNINSFAQDKNIWEELKRYEFSEGITAEEIQEIFYTLVWWVLTSIMIVFTVIGGFIYKTTSYIKK